MAYIEMRFHPDKPVEFKTVGIPGPACHAASKPYQDAIGGKVISSVPTPEANQNAAVSENVKLKG